MSIEYDLPQGWQIVTLSDLCEVERGITFPASEKSSETSKDSIACLRTASVQENVVWNNLIYVPKQYVKNERKLVSQNDILISMANSRELVGKVAFVAYLPTESTFGAFIAAIRVFSGINPKFLFYFLRFDETLKKLRKTASQTVNIANLSLDDIYTTAISLSPLNEQHRIVAAIEQQFSRLAAAATSLQHARTKLKRQRAAILKAAVEGTLTGDWRAQHPVGETADQLLQRILHERRAKWEAGQLAKMQVRGVTPKDDSWKKGYKEPEPPDTESLPELPDGWVWANMAQVVSRSEYGTSVKCDYEAQGIPVLRIPNIAAGEIDLSDLKYSTLPLNISRDDALQPGDLLVCRTNGSIGLIGKTALVRVQLDRIYTFASYLLRFRLFEANVLPKWLYLFLTSMQGRDFIERNAASSAGQHNISLTLIHGMVFPLPPLAEQQQIVSEVEARLAIIEQTELEVEANLKRAERLRQIILAEAFAGRLVPQDPDDEPASVLLERIRREREERDETRKKGKVGNGCARAAMRVPDEEVNIDVEGMEQVELWESVMKGNDI